MAKTYVPHLFDNIHLLAVYMTRYNSVIRVTLAVLDPDSVATYDAARGAVLALDALRTQLLPIVDSEG